jgi:HEPN domain-containing protein
VLAGKRSSAGFASPSATAGPSSPAAGDPPLRDSAAFHCQQAVEKLLKGFLTLAGKRGGKPRSPEQRGALAQQSFPAITGLVAPAHDWSKWATAYRYPQEDAPPEPDEAEIRAALAVIDALAARLRAANPEPPGS